MKSNWSTIYEFPNLVRLFGLKDFELLDRRLNCYSDFEIYNHKFRRAYWEEICDTINDKIGTQYGILQLRKQENLDNERISNR